MLSQFFFRKSRYDLSTLKSHLLFYSNQGGTRAEGKCQQAPAWTESVTTDLAGALLHPQWKWNWSLGCVPGLCYFIGVSINPHKNFHFVLQNWKLKQRDERRSQIAVTLKPHSPSRAAASLWQGEGDPEGLPSGAQLCGA